MNPLLVKYSDILEKDYIDYISEWEDNNEAIVPWAARRDGSNFSDILARWEFDESEDIYAKGLVPSTLYFYIETNGRIIGALHFRHALNDHLLKHGGHIGYGIRKTERNKGFAFKMLNEFINRPKAIIYDKYLLTCDDENIGSYKVIEKCNGILENKIDDNGKVTRRYWIYLR